MLAVVSAVACACLLAACGTLDEPGSSQADPARDPTRPRPVDAAGCVGSGPCRQGSNRDAATPRDAGRAHDADHHPDAGEADDAALDGGVDALPDASDPPDAGGDCHDDTHEDNDGADTATLVSLRYVGELFSRFGVPSEMTLCGGDEDWFEVPSSLLPWDEPFLFIRAYIADIGLCSGICHDPELPAGPARTMTIEVYSKATGELIVAGTSEEGNVWITHGDVRFAGDVYVRIYGPPVAAYDYRLYLDLRAGWFEDECEC